MNKFTSSIKNLPKIVIVLLVLLFVLLVFKAGMEVGYRKATYSYHWDRSYSGAPRSFLNPFMSDSDDLNAHGVFGQIVSVRLPLLMIKGKGANEQVVNIGSSTEVHKLRADASTSDLHSGDFVVVIGDPNDQGVIDASLIRILPIPPNQGSTSANLNNK